MKKKEAERLFAIRNKAFDAAFGTAPHFRDKPSGDDRWAKIKAYKQADKACEGMTWEGGILMSW